MIFSFDPGTVAAAIGALGTASFALVDATKVGWQGGISNSGFVYVEAAVKQFVPGATRRKRASRAGQPGSLLDVLHSNWINGRALVDQKAIAKSLIKLSLSPANAAHFGTAANVDGATLKGAATNMNSGQPLDPSQVNVIGRLDVALTSTLDEAYQRADQQYRNRAKVLAAVFAVVLGLVGGASLSTLPFEEYIQNAEAARAFICGLLAVPLAPISKDIASALSAGVKLAQALQK